MSVHVSIATLNEDLDSSLSELRRDLSPIRRSRAFLEAAVADGTPTYGVNTGFGKLDSKKIADEDLRKLQKNLLLSHAVGVGDPVPRSISRLMLLLKIHSLGRGYSGISERTFTRLLDLAERDLISVIPSKGSVGASGDLAPLAHMALPLIGRGFFWGDDDEPLPAAEVLEREGLEPIELAPKDGLSLINGTQLMSAYGAFVMRRALQLERSADILAAMSLEALQGSLRPFDERVHRIRPHPGQEEVAGNIRFLLADSEITESHRDCGKVQDPYSLRCVPQVHGASRDALAYVRSVIEIELNAVTDNPLVFEPGEVISAGNFHGQPLALAMDHAAIALAELASISERRIYLLLEGHDGLPQLLMRETGVNSGFMIPHYTAAALVSENKILCHPASVDSIPTSLGQEDHVSMGSISALKLLQVMQNLEYVLAIELLTAAQALDYRLPIQPGRGVAVAHAYVRERIPHREADYLFQDDLTPCLKIIRSAALQEAIARQIGPIR